MRNLIKLGLPRANQLSLGLFLTVLQGLSAVALMAVSGWLISRAGEHPPILYLNMAVVLVRGFALGRAFFRYTERLVLHDSAFKMLADIRPRLFSKLIPLAPAGLGNLNQSDSVTRLVNDVDELQNLPLRVVAPLVQSVLVSVATVAYLAWLQPGAAVALFVSLLLAAVVALPLSARFSKRANAGAAASRAKLHGDTAALLENLDVLEAYGWTDDQVARVSASQASVLAANRTNALTGGVGLGSLAFLAALATAATTYFGAVSVISGQQPRVMLAVIALLPLAVFDVLTNVQPTVGAWQRYLASAKRVSQLLETQPDAEIVAANGNASLKTFESLELIDAAAHYPNQTAAAFSGVNLRLAAGETLHLKGASGRGKTTIGLVLTGLLNLSLGNYLINGTPAAEYNAEQLRTKIGYLEQTPTIFLGSLRENLVIANPEASDHQLLEVIERVGLTKTFVGRAGLDTQLGEKGFAISGGEAQRVALARALLANFQVIIFDEPTANVDAQLAEELWNDLLSVVANDPSKAAIFISHETLSSERFTRVINL